MDKRSVLAIALIFLIVVLWEPYKNFLSPPEENPIEQTIDQQQADIQPAAQQATPASTPIAIDQEPAVITTGAIAPANLDEVLITVETPLYRGVFTSKGGTILEWTLFNYPGMDGEPVNLIRNNEAGNLGLSFMTTDGYNTNMNNFDFIPENATLSGNKYRLSTTDSEISLVLTADLDDGKKISKTFRFDPYSYAITMDLLFENMHTSIANQSFDLTWGSGIRASEKTNSRDVAFFSSWALLGDEDVNFDVGTSPTLTNEPLSGTLHWIATRSKYFSSIIVPIDAKGNTARLSGTYNEADKAIGSKNYVSTITMDYKPLIQHVNSFMVYLGPIDYNILKKVENNTGLGLGLTELMDFNSFTEPVTLMIYAAFRFLHGFVPNYGVVIILFSFLINLLMYPLTAKSYKSMKKMQEVQPLLTELKEKYKDDPQRMQQAQIKLYKELKINPVGGCLPMLLQMPIFFAIYPIFRTIELRGAPFVFWIKDLSLPDTVATLPFSLPMFGNQINILIFIYTIVMFIQQKTTVTDPKQKAMIYVMPVMMLLFLNQLSSGFILYFIIFMLFSIAQRFLAKDNGETKAAPAVAKLQNQLTQKRSPKKKKK